MSNYFGRYFGDSSPSGGGGTSTDPGVSNVRSGVAYGIDSVGLTGTLALPPIIDVRLGVGYGAGGTELVGTLFVPTAGTPGAARILAIADAIAANIAALWAASSSPPSGSDAVTRAYEVPIGDADDESNIIGRQVYVFPTEFHSPELATRGEDYRDYEISILTAERYADAAGQATKAWLDVRVAFVEQIVWLPLSNATKAFVFGQVFSQLDDVIVYDPQELRTKKLFLSLVNVTLRELL